MKEKLSNIRTTLQNKQEIFYKKFFAKNTDIDITIKQLLKKVFLKFSFLYLSFQFSLYSLKKMSSENLNFKNKEKIYFYIEKFNKICNDMDNILMQLEDTAQNIKTK